MRGGAHEEPGPRGVTLERGPGVPHCQTASARGASGEEGKWNREPLPPIAAPPPPPHRCKPITNFAWGRRATASRQAAGTLSHAKDPQGAGFGGGEQLGRA